MCQQYLHRLLSVRTGTFVKFKNDNFEKLRFQRAKSGTGFQSLWTKCLIYTKEPKISHGIKKGNSKAHIKIRIYVGFPQDCNYSRRKTPKEWDYCCRKCSEMHSNPDYISQNKKKDMA